MANDGSLPELQPVSYLSGKRVVAIINCEGGSAAGFSSESLEETLSGVLRGAGASLDFRAVQSKRLPAELRSLSRTGADVVLVGGGDGSVNAAVNELRGTDTAVGILPLGTLNHFAQSLGIPAAMDEAVQSLVQATPRALDVGEVNGRLFVNNGSIGIYPEAVRMRDDYMKRFGLRKYAAMGYAFLTLMTALSKLDILVEVQRTMKLVRTPFLFVGNNRYRPGGFQYARRESLTQGVLSVFYAGDVNGYGLAKIAVKVLLGRFREAPELEILETAELTVRSRTGKLRVALDGEVVRMSTPLRFRILPGALKILAPAEES